MRPLKLTMEAFESYLKPQTIDFDPLNAARIFIISGKTGAGKTTIFDAILYALYGELSSAGRNKSKQYKTVMSPEEEGKHTCKVILEFEQNGKTYRVTRIPAQKMPGKGERTKTTASESVVLENLSDPTDIIPSKNAQAYLDQLLGLDSNQFRQVCLISQGSFSEVLTANTTEKKKIFRDLFGTGIFDEFVTQLDAEVKKREGNRDSEIRALDSLYQSVSLKEEDKAIGGQIQEHEERLKFLEEKKSQYQDEDAKLNQQIEENNEKQTTLTVEDSKATDYEDNLKRKADFEKKLKEKKTELAEKEKLLSELKTMKPETEKKKAEQTSLENQLKEYEMLEQTKTELDQANQNLTFQSSQKEQLEKRQVDLTKSNQKNQETLNQTEERLSKEKEVSVDFANVQNRKRMLEDERKKTVSLKDKIQKELPSCLNQRALAQKEENQAKEKAEEMETSYFASVTGILSQQLKEGEPCPVCGSCRHPHPHVHTEEEVTEAEYKEADTAYKKASEKSLSAQNALNHLNEDIRSRLDEMKDFLSGQGVEAMMKTAYGETYESFSSTLNQLIQENSDEYRRLSAEMEEFSRLHQEETKLKDTIQKDTVSIQKLNDSLKDVSGEIIRLETEVKNLTTKVQEKKQGLCYASKKEADRRIFDLKREIQEYESRFEKTEKDYTSAKENIASLSGQLQSVQESIESYQGREKDVIETELREVTEMKKNLEDSFRKLVSYETSIQNGISLYKKKYEAFEKENHEYSLYSNLLNVFKGKNTNENSAIKGVDLETYVLARYLDDIISFANHRLLLMSDGRYQMERRKNGFKGGGQQGLDIDIVDQYTMESRQAGTLSGGETFMASLSLALGLSDKVRMMTSQKDIDVLFVDEGFGSLDEEALIRAADTLKDLAATDRKTIGLISHVEGLLPLFEMKLTVEKDSEGHSKVILP